MEEDYRSKLPQGSYRSLTILTFQLIFVCALSSCWKDAFERVLTNKRTFAINGIQVRKAQIVDLEDDADDEERNEGN